MYDLSINSHQLFSKKAHLGIILEKCFQLNSKIG